MRVRCTLPNMSAQVSGVRFTPDPDGGGWVSDDLTPALAQAFALVPGYRLEPDATDSGPASAPAEPATVTATATAADSTSAFESSRGRPRKSP